MTMLSYAINVFLVATGRLVINQPPVISDTATGYTDPLPQALVLTAIVISFGMTALIVVLALRAYLESGTRSEEHTSELQSLMRISYAVFCLKKKKTKTQQNNYMRSNLQQK